MKIVRTSAQICLLSLTSQKKWYCCVLIIALHTAQIARILAEALGCIARCEKPDDWPELLPTLLEVVLLAGTAST